MKPAEVERASRYETWPVAMVALTTEMINAAGYEVGRDIDDLDEYCFADIADAKTGPIFLILHDQAISRAFTVYAAVEFSRKDALIRLERELHCHEKDDEWITPYAAFPGYLADEVNPNLIARTRDGTPLDSMPWSRRFEAPLPERVSRPA